MGIVGILLAILTVATLLYAVYVIFIQPAPKNDTAKEQQHEQPELHLQTDIQHIHEPARPVAAPASIMPYVVPEESDVATDTEDMNSIFEQYVSGKFNPQYF